MCTVSFLPLPEGGYLLATNRDESPRRGPARPPSVRRQASGRLLAPTDSDAGGSWVAVDGAGRSLCVLNGDRPPAAPEPAHPLSRGLLLLELMARPEPEAVMEQLWNRLREARLEVKAFKLVLAQAWPRARCACVTFDGAELIWERFPGPALFVSSRFEPERTARLRGELFALLARREEADGDALRAAQLAYHRGHAPGAPEGDADSVCMHREDAHTRSLTVVDVSPAGVCMGHVGSQPCEGGPLLRYPLPPA